MRIDNRMFPYPVLSSSSDDYNDASFDIGFSDQPTVQNRKLVFPLKISLTGSQFLKALENDEISVAIHVEASKTRFRNLYPVSLDQKSLKLPVEQIFGRVEMCAVIFAKKPLLIDQTYNLNEDYEDASFPVKPGYILGYCDLPPVDVPKSIDDLHRQQSIFTVVKKLEHDIPMTVNLDDDRRIQIILGSDVYEQFVHFQQQSNAQVTHSMIVFPALVYVLDTLSSDARETYDDKAWYYSLTNLAKSLGVDFEEDNDINTLELAQEMLKYPVYGGLNWLTQDKGEDLE